MLPLVPPPGVLTAVRALRDGLAAYGSAAPVSTELPPSGAGLPALPSEFVVAGRIPSAEAPHSTDTVGLLVECYAPDELAAERLANVARAALDRSQGIRYGDAFVIWWHEASRPVRFDHPDTDTRVRYQFTGTLCVQAAPTT